MSTPRTDRNRLVTALLRPRAGAALLALLMLVLETAGQVAGPLLIAVVIDRGVPEAVHGRFDVVGWCTAGYLGTALVATAARFAFFRLSARIGQELVLDLRTRIFRHALALPVAFHERAGSGQVITWLTSDVRAVDDMIETALDGLLTSVLTVASIGVLLLWLDLPLGLLVFAGFVPLVWLTNWYRVGSREAYGRARTRIARITAHVAETMSTVRVVQACRTERADAAHLHELGDDFRRDNTAALSLVARYMAVVRLLGNAALVLVLAFGAWRVVDGSLQLGVLTAFVLYLRKFYDPLDELAHFTDRCSSAGVALTRISGFLAQRPSVPEPAVPVPFPALRGRGADVEFRHVDFRYSPTGPIVLSDVDLTIPAGQTVALVGSTGAGKSTVARLLARFYDPVGGTVTVNGIELDRVSEAELRRHVVMVTQENFLFEGTIADNIALGRPDASRAEVERVARRVGMHDAVRALPDGYDTEVGSRGSRLSAGQRQLVAVARVLLVDPAVLVLDEATSQLDGAGEQVVQDALAEALRGRTAVVIAHRLTTAMNSDRVLVLDGGRIVDDDAPERAVAAGGRFAELYRVWSGASR